MKCSAIYSSVIFAIVLFAGSKAHSISAGSTSYVAEKKNAPEGRIEPITTSLVVSALAPVVLNLFTGVLGNLFNKPNDTEERVIYGRPMQVKLCGAENCMQLLDKGSGITKVGKGDTVQHAMGDAISAMLTALLERNLLSMHDLCREHIHFPHPDKENCPNVEINTCELSKPVIPKPPCMDSHGTQYCQRMKQYCKNHLYADFLKEVCYKTCTDNCAEPPRGPCDY